MVKRQKDIDNTLLIIALLNLPLVPLPITLDRRNHRQELILLLLLYMESRQQEISYILLRDVFKGYGRIGWQDLAASLRKSGYIIKDGHMGNYLLTDKGRAFARQIDKDLQAEHKALRKLYKDTTK